MDQHEYVRGALAYYAENYYEPGNTEDGEWQDCHYPAPKCLGGTETVKLLRQHHAVQGVLQSEEYQYPCIYGWEKKYLPKEYLSLFDKWFKEQKRLGNKAQKESTVYAEHCRKRTLKLWQDPAYRDHIANEARKRWQDINYRQKMLHVTGGGPGTEPMHLRAHTEKQQREVEVTQPDGSVVTYPSLMATVRALNIPSKTIRNAMKRQGPTRSGFTFRYTK